MNKSIEDFYVSLKVFNDNLRAYISVVLFVLAGSFGVLIIGLAVFGVFILIQLFGLTFTHDAIVLIFLAIAILFFMVLLVVFAFSAFNATLYGLSYDIMSSGNLYTEFRNAFIHFRKHWLSYIVISIIMLLITMVYQFFNKDQLALFLVYAIFDYFSIMYITGLFTSVTAKGSFLTACKESFSLLRNDFKRIALTIGLYFLIFRTPYIVSVYISKLGLVINSIILILLIINFLLLLFSSFIGNPILSILATRIYNTN